MTDNSSRRRSPLDDLDRSVARRTAKNVRYPELLQAGHLAEGIVFHHADGRRAKKARRARRLLRAATTSLSAARGRESDGEPAGV
jgi:hypothetical protein